MRKEAVGIAINGREVKIAHVYRDKYRLGVDFLESAVFTADMDYELRKKPESGAPESIINEEEDIFAIKNPYEAKISSDKEASIRENIDVLYSLLRKFAARRIKIAFNVPPSQVTYQDLDTHSVYDKNVFRGSLKKKIEGWKQGFNALDNVSIITRKDGTLCNVACETQQPPIIEMLDHLNTFFKGNLFLSLMDPNEVSLVNLARRSYNFQDYAEISVLVQIETEFSRVIFMKGEDIINVSPIITESFNPDIVNIVYSKIIYEMDNSNISEVSNILLAGRASSINAKSFFEKKFPGARVGFIISQPLAENLSTQFSREDLSSYAIPIALAWKVIDASSETFIPTNLLPAHVIGRQKVLNLSYIGVFMLVLLGISAFILTWKITAKKIDVSNLKSRNLALQQQINNSEKTVKLVNEIDNQIIKLKKRIILSDSLSFGSDRLLSFLEKLNESVARMNTIWVEEIQNSDNGTLIKGMALQRGDVPKISEALGGTKIIKLTRTDTGGRKIFSFEMEANWKQTPFQRSRQDQLEPKSPPSLKVETIDTKLASGTISNRGNATSAKPVALPEENSVVKSANTGDFERGAREMAQGTDNKEIKKIDQSANFAMTPHETQKETAPAAITNSKNLNQTSVENTGILNRENVAPKNEAVNRPDVNSRFVIQISAHASKFTAQKEVESYQAKGFNTYVTTLAGSSHEIPYWVCLGDFNTYHDAETELHKLNNAVPGRRNIVEISKNEILQNTFSTSNFDAQETSVPERKFNNNLIRKANQTVVLSSENNDENKRARMEPGSGTYAIRISAHVTKLTANKEVEFYRSKGLEAYVTKLPKSSPDIPYSVCLGAFSSYAEAEQKIKELIVIIPRSYDVVSIKD